MARQAIILDGGSGRRSPSERESRDRRPQLVTVAAALALLGLAAFLGAKRLTLPEENGKRLTVYRRFSRFIDDHRRHPRSQHAIDGFVSDQGDSLLGDADPANEHLPTEQPLSSVSARSELDAVGTVDVPEGLDPHEGSAQKQRRTKESESEGTAASTFAATLERRGPPDKWRLPHDVLTTESQLMPVGALGETRDFPTGTQGRRRPLLFYLLVTLAGARSLKHVLHLEGGTDPAAPSGPSPLAEIESEIPPVTLPEFTTVGGLVPAETTFFVPPLDIPPSETPPS
ncbi:putative transmembrane protein [Toxoplasma gondii TgCatPRC2]|uniref:Transmembrane protein n=3 Tax=Toxoplasma gondii TaxID=5811 RepID=S8ESM0_TOXGM|nr:hypothetical protein TGME49_275460 [Toxoplasma gondii ME49]EPT26401.1 hypothetical protein TGME49_275460 [Toxoplasma gondii ME49]KFG36275.1 putative transmembrane protein [Toxoplasma gondii GAB2-2007-GAL-DOM2]KYK63038.1 putative transmembrane protein [Toxoplasma gondii TgCatPRC2]|eukprot:XP_002371941.1 hypothetical protein TGME49_275460 [Toxoplasma gondii ME49]